MEPDQPLNVSGPLPTPQKSGFSALVFEIISRIRLPTGTRLLAIGVGPALSHGWV